MSIRVKKMTSLMDECGLRADYALDHLAALLWIDVCGRVVALHTESRSDIKTVDDALQEQTTSAGESQGK